MKASEIKLLSAEEIAEKLKTQRENYQQLKFNHRVSPLKNPLEIRSMRRDIARLATALRQTRSY